MKRILLAAALLVTASSAFAEWKLVESNDQYDLYYESSRVRREGNSVKFWGLFSFKEYITSDSMKYRSRINLTQLDCQNEKLRVLTIAYYSEAMGNGTTLKNYNSISEWNDVIPRSIGDHFAQLLCPKR